MNTKKQNIKLLFRSLGLALVGLGLVACSPKEEAVTPAASDASEAGAALFLDEAPIGALNVAKARLELSPGDEALIQGQIGGVDTPFLSGYAGFVLADAQVVFCDELGDDDHCATPWDACCEDVDQLKARRVSVQFVDAKGVPVESDLKASGQLKELDHVVVVGKVAEVSSKENMIIYAEKMALVQ